MPCLRSVLIQRRRQSDAERDPFPRAQFSSLKRSQSTVVKKNVIDPVATVPFPIGSSACRIQVPLLCFALLAIPFSLHFPPFFISNQRIRVHSIPLSVFFHSRTVFFSHSACFQDERGSQSRKAVNWNPRDIVDCPFWVQPISSFPYPLFCLASWPLSPHSFSPSLILDFQPVCLVPQLLLLFVI